MKFKLKLSSFSRTVTVLFLLNNFLHVAHSDGTRVGKPTQWEVTADTLHTDYSYAFDLPKNPDECAENPPHHYDHDEHYQDEHYQDDHPPQQTRTPRILNSGGSGLQEHITLTLPENSQCFKVFQAYECNKSPHEIGAYLQFLHVKAPKIALKLNIAGKLEELERLLNFKIFPNSFQLCNEQDTNPMKMKKEHCHSQFQLEIKGTTSKILGINDKCVALSASKAPRAQAALSIVRKNPQDQGTVCLEVFTQPDCKGDIVRVVLPRESSLWKGPGTAEIWEYFSDSKGNPNVDIDIKSVRKCSYCLQKQDTENNTSVTDYSTVSPSKPHTSPSPPAAAAHQDQKESDFHQSCFHHCPTISSLINHQYEAPAEKNCFFYFNESKCLQPIVQENHANLTILRSIVGRFPVFENWTVAECSDQSSQCLLEPKPKSSFKIEQYLVVNTKQYRQSVSQYPLTQVEIIVLAVAGSLAFIMLILVAIMGFLLWRQKRRIRDIRHLRYFPNKRHGQEQESRNLTMHQVDAIEVNDYVNDVTGLTSLCASFAGGFEIPRDHINIGNIRDSTACIIGVGEISIAFKGRLEPQGKTVAVKTMKTGQATTRSIKGILKEAQMFMQLGKHPGILELVGVCTENVRSGEVFTVTTWCENGALRGFLAQQKSHFVSLVEDGEWVNDDTMQKALDCKSFIEKGPPVKFNTIQLFKWCSEVADAMEYLAVRKIIHVSLSARNVLLDGNFHCKISDFHMAKVSGDFVPSGGFNSTTLASNERLIPWRWCAVESLLDDVFSSQSDVWTFGVFLWEVFSLGAVPYPEYSYGSEFTLCIKHGYRLQTPNFTTVECYQLMLMCWYDAPEKRPSFTKLKAKLDEMTPKKNVPISPGPFQIIRSLSKSSTQ